jgi:hypothetical protein
LLKVYIFKALLADESDAKPAAGLRGYFVCPRSEPHFKTQLRDALAPMALRVKDIEREQEITEELLFQSLPHVHAMYRLRGYGLELYPVKEAPEETGDALIKPGFPHAVRRLTSNNLLAHSLSEADSTSAQKKHS